MLMRLNGTRMKNTYKNIHKYQVNIRHQVEAELGNKISLPLASHSMLSTAFKWQGSQKCTGHQRQQQVRLRASNPYCKGREPVTQSSP